MNKLLIPDSHFPDVLLCLTRGAGLLLTPGMDDRHQVEIVLEDALREPLPGEWESEIGGLVQRGEWETIKTIADKLRREQPLMCLRCYRVWHGNPKTRTCPGCRSAYWNRPRKPKKSKEEQKK